MFWKVPTNAAASVATGSAPKATFDWRPVIALGALLVGFLVLWVILVQMYPDVPPALGAHPTAAARAAHRAAVAKYHFDKKQIDPQVTFAKAGAGAVFTALLGLLGGSYAQKQKFKKAGLVS